MKSNRVNEYPPILEDLGTGRSYYNFHVISTAEEDGSISYDYDQVSVENPATGEKIIQSLKDDGYYVSGKKRELKSMVESDCETLKIPEP